MCLVGAYSMMCARTWGCARRESTHLGGCNAVSHVKIRQKLASVVQSTHRAVLELLKVNQEIVFLSRLPYLHRDYHRHEVRKEKKR